MNKRNGRASRYYVLRKMCIKWAFSTNLKIILCVWRPERQWLLICERCESFRIKLFKLFDELWLNKMSKKDWKQHKSHLWATYQFLGIFGMFPKQLGTSWFAVSNMKFEKYCESKAKGNFSIFPHFAFIHI